MNIVTKRIDEIIPYEKNPRKNDEAVKYVAASIKEFGFKVPIVIDKNNVIVAGHTRYKASKKLGLDEVPCIIADDLTDEQIKAYRLADNKVAEKAEWDFNLLGAELDDLFDFDMTPFGFEDVLDDEPVSVEEDEVPEVDEEAEPITKLGDIWQLGRHRLMCGDSTDSAMVSKLMDNNIAEISFTSPPYNVGHNLGYDDDSKYENDDDNKDEYSQFLINFTQNAYENSQYTFVNIQQLANNKIDLIEWLYKFKDCLSDTMIWDKGHSAPAMAHKVMNSCFEYIYVFNENAKRSIGTKDFHGTVENILRIPSQRNNEYSDIHNATFPIALPTAIIETFTNENESVLDLFGGTGTTLIACEQLERTCYMMEFDPKYCDVIVKRWETLTGEKAVLIND